MVHEDSRCKWGKSLGLAFQALFTELIGVLRGLNAGLGN